MMLFANILAILALTITPFLQPCFCSGFTLFCECRLEVCCDSHGCSSESAPQPDDDVPPLPDHDKPCGEPLAPELGKGIAANAGAQAVDRDLADTAPIFALPELVAVGRAIPVRWSRPPPIGLIVVSTSFLRI